MNLATLVDVLASVKTHGSGFENLPPAYWDPEMFTRDFHRSLVRFHWSAAHFVPSQCLDVDLCAELVRKDPRSLQIVPQHLLTRILSEVLSEPHAKIVEIVRECPGAWPLVPQHLRKKTLLKCISEAQGDVAALLTQVPPGYLDGDLCNAAVECSHDSERTLQLIPAQFRTRELCRIFISMSDSWLEDLPPELQFDNMRVEMALAGYASIDDVPMSLRTQEVYERANFKSLAVIPKANRSETLCMKAVEQDGRDLQYVPPSVLSDAIALQAVTSDGMALEFVPRELLSEVLALRAVTTTGTALKLVPKEWMSESVIAAALRSDPVATAYVPAASRDTPEFIEAAKRLPGRVEQIPDELLDEDFAKALVTAEGRLLMELPLRLYTSDICEAAFGNHELPLFEFPEQRKTREACLASVRHWWRSLHRVPPQLLFDGKQPDLCEAAIRTGPSAFKYVPPDHPRREELRALAIELARGRDWSPEFIDRELR